MASLDFLWNLDEIKWKSCIKILKDLVEGCQRDRSLTALTTAILEISQITNSFSPSSPSTSPTDVPPKGLKMLIKFIESLSSEDYVMMVDLVVPSLVESASSASTNLPRALSFLDSISNPVLSLSRQHAHYLISLMFFNLIPNTKSNLDRVCFRNYFPLFDSTMDTSLVHIRSLFNYLCLFASDISKIGASLDNNILFGEVLTLEINAESATVESLLADDRSLVPFKVFLDGAIDLKSNESAIDFANERVSFGPGGTQEEIVLGCSPESHVVSILAPTLKANESLIIRGAVKVSEISDYGLDLKYVRKKPLGEHFPKRAIIAIDANPFPEIDYLNKFGEYENLLLQLQADKVDREILKALAGFRSTIGMELGTGNWGCNNYNGNKELKAVIQWVAASIAQVASVNYYVMGDSNFEAKFVKFQSAIIEKRVTAAQLYRSIEKARARLERRKLQYFSFFDTIVEMC